MAGGTFVDVIIDEAHDPQALHPFKGNVDLGKVEALINKVGAEHIPYVCLAANGEPGRGAAGFHAKCPGS